VKLGIVTPVLTLLPRAHAQWEESASFDDVVSIVREADRLGYHHCTCSEHVAVPVDIALSRTQPEYHGRYFDFEGFLVEPSAVQPRVPMWVGGRTRRSLRRAIELGDGWAPFGLRTSELRDMLRQVDVPLGFDVLLQSEHPLDPIGEPERVRDELERLASIGATGANVRFVNHSPAHYREQLAALLAVAPPN